MKFPFPPGRRFTYSLLLAVGVFAAPLRADDDDRPGFVAGEIAVKLNPAYGATIAQINATWGTRTLSTVLASAGIFLVAAPAGADTFDHAGAMQGDSRLAYAEPNYIGDAPESGGHVSWAWTDGTPTPAGLPASLIEQAAARRLNLGAAHARATGAGVVVAVLDTGIEHAHPLLRDRLAPGGYDFVGDDAVPEDEAMQLDADGDGRFDANRGHGTHVAGVVALTAPGARILPLRVLDSEGRGNLFTLAEALDHAVRSGARVVNLSLGLSFRSRLLEDAVLRAQRADVLVVAAAGNRNTDKDVFPAALPGVLGVASLDDTDRKSAFTNWGQWVAVSAPGEAIGSAYFGARYARWSGTSMAAPFAAGQAALLRGTRTTADADLTAAVLLASCVELKSLNPDWDGKLGAGRLDPMASLDLLNATPKKDGRKRSRRDDD
jgi:thermitase